MHDFSQNLYEYIVCCKYFSTCMLYCVKLLMYLYILMCLYIKLESTINYIKVCFLMPPHSISYICFYIPHNFHLPLPTLLYRKTETEGSLFIMIVFFREVSLRIFWLVFWDFIAVGHPPQLGPYPPFPLPFALSLPSVLWPLSLYLSL